MAAVSYRVVRQGPETFSILRRGVRGGTRFIASYRDETTAMWVCRQLNYRVDREANG